MSLRLFDEPPRVTDAPRSKFPSFLPALIAYLLVDLLFFGKVLIPGRYLYGGDFMTYFYPMKQFLRTYVLEHDRLPLWNPYLLCGYPFIADIQVSAFYPGGILMYLFSPEKSYAATLAIHFLLMAMGMYLFAGRMGYSRLAAWVAGIVYAFNGFALRNLSVGHLTLFQTMAMAPWLWGSYLRAIPPFTRGGRGGSRGWALVAIFTALILFGGCPQNALYALLFLLMLAICLPWFDPEISLRKSMGVFAACVGTGFLIASVQLLPTAEFTAWSPRSNGISYEAAMSGSLHPADLLNFFFPKIFGNPIAGTYWLRRDVHPFWEAGSYVGILTVAAIFGFRWKTATRFERVCMGMLILSLAFALGKYNPLVPFIQSLPIFNFFRGPIRLLYLAVTASSILAAGLIQRIGQREEIIPLRRMMCLSILLLVGVFSTFYFVSAIFPEGPDLNSGADVGLAMLIYGLGVLAVLLGIYGLAAWKFNPRAVRLALAGMLVLDLFAAGNFLIIPTDKFQQLGADAREIRKQIEKQGGGLSRLYERAELDMGNLPLLTRQFSIRGYDPIMLSHYVRFILAIEGRDLSLEDQFTYVDLDASRLDHPALRMAGFRYATDLVDDTARIFPEALPRAFWVREAVSMPEDEALRKITDETFDPTRQIILSGTNLSPHPGLPPQGGKEASLEACRILEYDPNRLRIVVTAPEDGGYVFLGDVFYPGWRAAVDDRPAEIFRANYLFRAVGVPAGRHVIEMKYAPGSLHLGMILSGIGLLVCAVFFASGGYPRSEN